MSTDSPSLAQRRSVFWRIHAWAAIIASPFIVVAACTGLLYVFTPQLEQVLHARLDHVSPNGSRRPLDELVKAAMQAAPQGMKLRSVLVPEEADQSLQVVFRPARKDAPAAAANPGAAHAGHAGHEGHDAAAPPPPANRMPTAAAPVESDNRIPRGAVLYVDPYSGEVLGQHGEMERYSLWARRLHSSLLQGNGWRWMIELGASWMVVMLLTGVYLWWPRRSALPPKPGTPGRAAWSYWHAITGIVLALMSLVILTTGLTWSQFAGDQIRSFRDVIGQASPAPPKGLHSTPLPGDEIMNWEDVLQATRSRAPLGPVQIVPPQGGQGVWRVSSPEDAAPTGKFTLVLDAFSGRTMFYADWDHQTAWGMATAIGIPFHRGEFGWWNQAILFAFGAGVLFSLVSGWTMLIGRGRDGLPMMPRLLPGAWGSLPPSAWFTAAVLLVAMPLLALSALPVALTEAVLAWRRKGDAMAAVNG
jgi:uncharacterized iron-regulated membrane protein